MTNTHRASLPCSCPWLCLFMTESQPPYPHLTSLFPSRSLTQLARLFTCKFMYSQLESLCFPTAKVKNQVQFEFFQLAGFSLTTIIWYKEAVQLCHVHSKFINKPKSSFPFLLQLVLTGLSLTWVWAQESHPGNMRHVLESVCYSISDGFWHIQNSRYAIPGDLCYKSLMLHMTFSHWLYLQKPTSSWVISSVWQSL